MLIRQVLVGWTLTAPYSVAYGFYLANEKQAAWFGIVACIVLIIAISIIEIVWIFGPTHRRLIDYWAGTIVVNEAK